MAPSATSADVPPPSDSEFPCTLTLHIPFPNPRLASVALQAIEVDQELSPLVRRSLSLQSQTEKSTGPTEQQLLEVQYRATTNRMLRVAVNGFFESLGVVLSVMRELDTDVVEHDWIGDAVGTEADREDIRTLKKVQGVGEIGIL